MPRPVAVLLLAVSVPALAACASGGERAEPETVLVTVVNDLSPSQAVRIELVTRMPRSEVLGRVGRSSSRAFPIQVTRSGPYRLRAMPIGPPTAGSGNVLVASDRFMISPGSRRVVWSLRVNRVQVE